MNRCGIDLERINKYLEFKKNYDKPKCDRSRKTTVKMNRHRIYHLSKKNRFQIVADIRRGQ